MSKILIDDLKMFCQKALETAGMSEDKAEITAAVLTETDAYGLHSHGTKNLGPYIGKAEAGGMDLAAEPEILAEGPAYALVDAHAGIGMVSSVFAMKLACRKAKECGIALVVVKNSCHFGAAGYYANIAAKASMIGMAVSNVDPNMTIPGARGMVIGNNPFSYAAPSKSLPSVFLDIALSNIASLKVIQARKDGREVPSTWIVDKNGLPTTDPSHYPEEGAMQPMAAHKGYGMAVFVELLTGILSGGCTSMGGDIVSWCFEPEKKNNISHAFLVIDPEKFLGSENIDDRVEEMTEALHRAPLAKGSEKILVPGELEWNRFRIAEKEGIDLPADVEASLRALSEKTGIELKLF